MKPLPVEHTAGVDGNKLANVFPADAGIQQLAEDAFTGPPTRSDISNWVCPGPVSASM